MIECYGASRPQKGHSANEDAFLIERDPVPYAALFDGAGNAERAAHVVLRFFKLIIKDQSSKVADPAAWVKEADEKFQQRNHKPGKIVVCFRATRTTQEVGDDRDRRFTTKNISMS